MNDAAATVPEPTARTVVVRAPGRVNLIGDHTDYNGGFCLPVAIDQVCTVRATLVDDGLRQWRATSAQEPDPVVVDAMSADVLGPHSPWGRFLAAALEEAFAMNVIAPLTSVVLTISSTIPLGAGLSSSAALCVALGAVIGALGDGPDLRDARLEDFAHATEVRATGVPCGFMDQIASVRGVADQALLIDARERSVRHVPWNPRLAIVVAHCGVARRVAASEYARRRADCEAIAARIGVATLRDATIDQVRDDPLARHVVTENARVLHFVAALENGDPARMGTTMLESHASLRDDFMVSTPELDELVDAFRRADAFGARLTGAGFGGCVVGLVPASDADTAVAAVADHYRRATGIETAPFVAHPADGVRVAID